MITLRGYNDDLIHIEPDFEDTEEIEVGNKVAVFTFTTEDESEGVEISMWYEGPCWAFTIMQLPDSEFENPWTINIEQDSSYSMALSILSGEDIKWEYYLED